MTPAGIFTIKTGRGQTGAARRRKAFRFRARPKLCYIAPVSGEEKILGEETKPFAGRVGIVTGATRGIGRAVAL